MELFLERLTEVDNLVVECPVPSWLPPDKVLDRSNGFRHNLYSFCSHVSGCFFRDSITSNALRNYTDAARKLLENISGSVAVSGCAEALSLIVPSLATLAGLVERLSTDQELSVADALGVTKTDPLTIYLGVTDLLSQYKAVVSKDNIVVQLGCSVEHNGHTVDFGNINVIITAGSGGFFIKAEPDPGNFCERHFHPNISPDGTICLGDASAATRQALNRFDFLSAVSLIDNMLNHDTGGNPYLPIDRWLGIDESEGDEEETVCPVCDDSIDEDDLTFEYNGTVYHDGCTTTVDANHGVDCGGGCTFPNNRLAHCTICKTSVRASSISSQELTVCGVQRTYRVCVDCIGDIAEDARNLSVEKANGKFICACCAAAHPVSSAVVLSRNHVYCNECAVLTTDHRVKIIGHIYGNTPADPFNVVPDVSSVKLATLTYREAPGIRSDNFYEHVPMPAYISPAPVLVRCRACNAEHAVGVIKSCKLTGSDICPNCPGVDMETGISAITSTNHIRGFISALLNAHMSVTLVTHLLDWQAICQLDLPTGINIIKRIVTRKTTMALPAPLNATGWRALLNVDNVRIMR